MCPRPHRWLIKMPRAPWLPARTTTADHSGPTVTKLPGIGVGLLEAVSDVGKDEH